MPDVIITGASRGIGRAFAEKLGKGRSDRRLILVARDRGRLDEVVGEIGAAGGRAIAMDADLASIDGARALGRELARVVAPHVTLVHNAGIWPAKKVLTAEGFETAFVVNHLAPLAMQEPLLGLLRRVMVVGAGLMVKGRFDPLRTPKGEDFSALRTYANTKLCMALMARDLAEAHPELDVLVIHPGVVRTDLGARPSPLGFLLSLIKRTWETPETCAERLLRIFERERWSSPGEAAWMFEEAVQPWPEVAQDASARAALRTCCATILGSATH